jgi:hypothetical protein
MRGMGMIWILHRLERWWMIITEVERKKKDEHYPE